MCIRDSSHTATRRTNMSPLCDPSHICRLPPIPDLIMIACTSHIHTYTMHMHDTGSLPFVPPAMNLLWPIFWYATTMNVCCALKNTKCSGTTGPSPGRTRKVEKWTTSPIRNDSIGWFVTYNVNSWCMYECDIQCIWMCMWHWMSNTMDGRTCISGVCGYA